MQLRGHVCWRYEAVDPYLGGEVTQAVVVELHAMLSARFARLVAEVGAERRSLVRAVQYLVRSFDVSGLLEGDASSLRLYIATDDGVFEHAASITGAESGCIEWHVETWVIAFIARWSGNPAAWPLV